MRTAQSLRVLFLASLIAGATAWLLAACTDETAATPAGGDGGGGGADGSSSRKDGGVRPDDDADSGEPTNADAGDAAKDAKPGKDASGPGEAGTECFFNHDCQSALRCDCDEDFNCSCQPGVRGTGQNGIDTCDSGNECASSLCVEGPAGSGFICSDECSSPSDCTGKLPRCLSAGGVSFCARDPG